MTPNTGYFRTKTSIKAIGSTDRADGYLLTALSGNQLKIYTFVSASTAAANDESVLMPDDNPTAGRWHEYSDDRSTGFAYKMLCTTGATIAGSGKSIEFYAPHSSLELIIKVGFGMPALAAIATPIYIHRWSASGISNAQFISGIGYKEEPAAIKLPASGGSGRLEITSNFLRITAGVKKSDNLPDTPFVLVTGNTITLLNI